MQLTNPKDQTEVTMASIGEGNKTAANGMVRGEEDFEEPVGSPRVAS